MTQVSSWGTAPRNYRGAGGDSCGHNGGNPLAGAAHSRAPNGAVSRRPTAASHGFSCTLANVASCVLISF